MGEKTKEAKPVSEVVLMSRLDRMVERMPADQRVRVLTWLYQKHAPGLATPAPARQAENACRAVPLS